MTAIKIKQGKHFSNEWFGFITGYKKLAYTFNFIDAKYHLDKQNQIAWNKLFGTSGCFFPRLRYWSEQKSRYASFRFKFGGDYFAFYSPWHWTSARWGWRYNINLDQFEVTPYYYIKGQRFYDKKIFQFKSLEACSLGIEKRHNKFVFLEDKKYETISIFAEVSLVTHKLTCYFGGKKKAPKDIRIIRHKF